MMMKFYDSTSVKDSQLKAGIEQWRIYQNLDYESRLT